MLVQEQLTIRTQGRGTYDITGRVAAIPARAACPGLCTIFLHHTSASLILCENADPAVRSDLEAFFERLVPDGDSLFRHTAEGPDDMPAHVRTVLTQSSLSIPVRADGTLSLGTWQGIYLWEHREAAHARQITVTFVGEPA